MVQRKSVLLMSKAVARPWGEASTCGLPALERIRARVLGSKSLLRPTSRSAWVATHVVLRDRDGTHPERLERAPHPAVGSSRADDTHLIR